MVENSIANKYPFLETLLPLFLRLGFVPLLSNLLWQYEDKDIQMSVLGFLTWFQKTSTTTIYFRDVVLTPAILN